MKPVISDSFRQIDRNHVEANTLLFWGAMNRKENVDAVKWFLKEIFPRISLFIPDTKLYIVGANPPNEIVKLQSKQVTITGFVDNPGQYFEKCHLAVAPLRMGAGIKIKVLEYLEAGLPVVATTVGAEGIEHRNLVVADGAEDFARAVVHGLAGVPPGVMKKRRENEDEEAPQYNSYTDPAQSRISSPVRDSDLQLLQ